MRPAAPFRKKTPRNRDFPLPILVFLRIFAKRNKGNMLELIIMIILVPVIWKVSKKLHSKGCDW